MNVGRRSLRSCSGSIYSTGIVRKSHYHIRDGTQIRSFTHVSDSIKAIDILIRKGKIIEVYNIGNEKETSTLEPSKLVRKFSNSKSKIEFHKLPPDDLMRRAADITNMRGLGWQPTIGLEEGVKSILEYEFTRKA